MLILKEYKEVSILNNGVKKVVNFNPKETFTSGFILVITLK